MMDIMKMGKILNEKLEPILWAKYAKGVPLLGDFGSPFSPLFLQKGSPKVPFRGPERVSLKNWEPCFCFISALWSPPLDPL